MTGLECLLTFITLLGLAFAVWFVNYVFTLGSRIDNLTSNKASRNELQDKLDSYNRLDSQLDTIWNRLSSLSGESSRVHNKLIAIEKQIAEPTEITKEQIEEELGYKINIVQEKTNG